MPLIVRFYDPIIRGQDTHGRSLNQILEWDDEHLERSHDYIQILFPLPEQSMFAFNAPRVTVDTVLNFRIREELRHRLALAFHRMLHFYGFEIVDIPQPETSEASRESGQREPSKVEGDKHAEKTTSHTPGDNKSGDKSGKEPLRRDVPTERSEFRCLDVTCNSEHRIDRGDNWDQASRNWAVRMDHNHLRITRILRCLRVLGLKRHCDEFYSALQRVYDDPKINIGKRSMEFWERAVKLPLYIAPDGEKVRWLQDWDVRQAEESQPTPD